MDCRTVESNDGGVFVKSGLKFIIFDDLHVAPASTSTMFPLLGKFGLLEQRNIEEKVLELNSHKVTISLSEPEMHCSNWRIYIFNSNITDLPIVMFVFQIINLLKRALVSKQSLTGLLCDHPVETDSVNLDHLREKLFPKQENTTDPKFNAVRITIVQTKDDSSVLYAEVGYDFVDLVFGLLSLPLGSTIKAYGQVTSGGSSGLDNLYRSINGSGIGCVKQECQSLLLSPMLAPFFGCGSSVLLQVQESPIKSWYCTGCYTCLRLYGSSSTLFCNGGHSKHGTVNEFNPKNRVGSSTSSDAYLKGGLGKFIVTNDLNIGP